MLIPALLHGLDDVVDARCEALIERLAGGAGWDEAVGPERLDTRDTPGLLVLNGPSPMLAGTAAFQCYLPHFRVRDAVGQGRLAADVEAAVFAASLLTPWGVVGLLAPANVIWAHAPDRRRPLLAAALRHWPALAAEDGRYTVGAPRGQPLWDTTNNLKHVLANLGVPLPALQAPLPPGGLDALVRGLGLADGGSQD
ncbi:MAG TPA: hypothetical protein VGG29_16100 [Caulobacteraceae bacterium]